MALLYFNKANINLNFKLETQETNRIIYIIHISTIAATYPKCRGWGGGVKSGFKGGMGPGTSCALQVNSIPPVGVERRG